MRDKFYFVLSDKYEDVIPIFSKVEFLAEEYDEDARTYRVQYNGRYRYYYKEQIDDFIANGDWVVID